MTQTFDFIAFNKDFEKKYKKKFEEYMDYQWEGDIIVDRHRISFFPEGQYVIIDAASENVFMACKILRTKVPYDVLRRLINRDYSSFEGIEYLD